MLWPDVLEPEALEQATHLANLPFAIHHVAIMPDSHKGYGMPIGGVLACDNVIIPNAVGVDIGCGMCAVKTPWTSEEIAPLLKKIMGLIREEVPVGFNKHSHMATSLLPIMEDSIEYKIVRSRLQDAAESLGTLGGGNHFIEIQRNENSEVWIMLHSGSRNLGKRVCDYYNGRAKVFNKIYHSAVPVNWDLAFLPFDSVEGQRYFSEMQYCVDYAFANRKLMLDKICEIMNNIIKHKKVFSDNMINIAHNYAVMENHFGKNVIVHRKGATLAREGTIGIIPGSQGSCSYIVHGKGNRDSFCSCSHGAGRKLGRKEAQRSLDLDVEIRKLDNLGVVHGIRHQKDLDEAPGAYKDIDMVMKQQEDLVDIVEKLYPLAVIKG